MRQKLNWHDDPVVLLEKAVIPILSLVPTVFVRRESGENIPASDITLPFSTAVEMLRTSGIEMLRARNIPFEPPQVAPLRIAADRVEKLGVDLVAFVSKPADPVAKMALLKDYTGVIVGQIEAAIDAFRSVFITCVLNRQRKNAQRSDEAIRRLDQISKQIFFISINASVEAARAGEAGRSFQQISADIRALSQSAQEATRNLSDAATSQGPAI